jgi:hypothetical protein
VFSYDDYSDDEQKIRYYWLGECKSHKFGINYYERNSFNNFSIWYEKLNGDKTMRVSLDSELELCVFLKQSKFKTK